LADLRPRPISGTGPGWPVLALLAALMAFGLLGTRAIWDPDEGRYVETAREMVVSGNWTYPTLHGVPHFTKPPLAYWSIAAGMSLLGQNEWGARLYCGVAFAATVLVLAAFGETLCGGARGRWTGVVYATMLFPFAAASIVTTDTVLTLFAVVACFAFWSAWTRPAMSRPAAYVLWASLGLAFLTKGPPGLLPLLVIVPFALLAGDAPVAGRWVWFRPGALALFALLALPWYALAIHGAPGLLRYFLEDEVVRRVATDAHDRNAQWYKPLQLYLPALTLGVLPWCAFWPAALRRFPGFVRIRDRPAALFLTLWVVVPVLLFSLVRSRQPLYVLPVAPALALATVLGFRIGGERLRVMVAAAAAVGLLALRLVASRVDDRRDARAFADWLRPWIEDRATEVVIVSRNAHGADFYLDAPVSLARWDVEGDPRFRALESVAEEVDELSGSGYRHVFVVKETHVERLVERIRETGAEPVPGSARHGERVVVVDPLPKPGGRPARVGLVWGDPGAAVDRLDRARSVEDLVERLAPVEVVVLGENAGPAIPGRVDQARALWRLRGYGVPVRVRDLGTGEGPVALTFEGGSAVSVRSSSAALEIVSSEGRVVGSVTADEPVAWIELGGPEPVLQRWIGH